VFMIAWPGKDVCDFCYGDGKCQRLNQPVLP
jgi:hypothetical protein